MPLMYAFVARGHDVLCEYAAYQGNFSKVAAECLAKCPAHNAKFTYNADKHTFNFIVHNGFTFLAVADEEFGRQIPFGFLEKVKDDFLKQYGETAKNAVAGSLNRVYGQELKRSMEYAMAHPEEINKVAKVQTQVSEVKEIMMQNIEKVLDRGEKLELLVDKTENLRYQADQFQKGGKALRNKMWWQNIKMKLLVALILCVVVVIIFCFACFSGGRNCVNKAKSVGH